MTLDSTAAGSRRSATAAGSDDETVYSRILDSMTCGVMLIDARGVITTFNAAAADLLGIDRGDTAQRSFAEVFVSNESFDDFSEAVLAAMYDGSVGHHRVVRVASGERTVPLSIATSYLRDDSDGSGARLGVIAVFSDISEIDHLRARELELAGTLESKHQELGEAYRNLEARNRELGGLLRKVQAVRVVASACVVALVVGIGGALWIESPTAWFGSPEPPSEIAAGSGRFVTVEPSRIVSTITVASEIEPRRAVAVTSPIRDMVAAVHVHPGETVSAGRPLLDLDVTDARIERRSAEVAHLKAKAQVEEYANWTSSVDASRAMRAVTKAQIAFEAGKAELAQTNFLVDQGLVPAARGSDAEREQHSRGLDLEAAEQDLDAILAKGRESHEVARLELTNAAEKLAGLDAILKRSTVVAPVAGIVLRPGQPSAQAGGWLGYGTAVESGQHLLSIGDISGVTARGRVDEVDVRRIRPGQGVRIVGPAFPGVELRGTIEHVSSQAIRPGGRGLPSFDVTAAVENLSDEQREAVRLGMSAELEIVIHERDDALLVPIPAVDLSAGSPRVRLLDEQSGAVRVTDVTTGATTLDSVEIRSGLAPGDQVMVP